MGWRAHRGSGRARTRRRASPVPLAQDTGLCFPSRCRRSTALVISTSDLKRGAMMELDGQIVQIMSYEHQKIGRGSAQVRLKVKNIRTGAIFDTTAQAGSKWPRIRLDQRNVQYLYSEGDLHYVMDKDTYEQFPLSPQQLGDAVNYLKDGM